MKFIYRNFVTLMMLFAFLFVLNTSGKAQEVLNEATASKIVPTSFYFAGQSAPTQMRNSAVARVGKDRYVIAGFVDTSGYSTEISGKYEGFLITDSPIIIGGKKLETGAYGFGFSSDGKINIFDLSGKQILSANTTSDAEMKRPRPLMMSVATNSVRLYKGKNYVSIAAQ